MNAIQVDQICKMSPIFPSLVYILHHTIDLHIIDGLTPQLISIASML